MYGIPGYDDLVPDESEEGQQAWRAEAGQFLREADAIDRGPLSAGRCRHARLHQGGGHPGAGGHRPGRATSTRSPPCSTQGRPPSWRWRPGRSWSITAAAEAYLTRLRRSGGWLDQIGERLRAGAGQGRLPVAPLAEQAITWAEGVLAAPTTARCSSPSRRRAGPGGGLGGGTPGGRRGGGDTRRWPGGWPPSGNCSRGRGPADQAGLDYLPGGDEDYARAIRIYTTLPLSAEELHQTGLDHVAALEARAVELGAGLGLSGLDEVFAALRDSAGKIPPRRRSAGRRPPCGGPRRGPRSSSPRRCRRRAR